MRHVKDYVVGDGSKAGVTHGPLQNSMQYERVKTFFDDIEKQGWKVATGGKIEPSQGYFVTPTIIDRPDEDSRIVVEEPFGMCLLGNTCMGLSIYLQFYRSYCASLELEDGGRSHCTCKQHFNGTRSLGMEQRYQESDKNWQVHPSWQHMDQHSL